MSIDYSIIIPAYNEEAMLNTTINQLKEAMLSTPMKGEIIVTDNNSSDRTAEIAKQAGAVVVFEPVNQISRARNTGARQAKGRYLIFVDADTYVSPTLLQKTLDNLESGQCCGGGANVEFDSNISQILKAIMHYWNFISRIFRLAAGCYVYALRDDFKASGGFSENHFATEEIWFSLALKRAARKHKRKFRVITNPKAITSSRKFNWFSKAYQLKLIFVLTLLPFLMRYKWACGFWYKRPKNSSLENDGV